MDLGSVIRFQVQFHENQRGVEQMQCELAENNPTFKNLKKEIKSYLVNIVFIEYFLLLSTTFQNPPSPSEKFISRCRDMNKFTNIILKFIFQ